ncbi:hypothetical protein GCM10023310_65480 [Paenibacillus vulneris]|uniref:Uncharacterized protein n=1 Tax=Paenibacillus vulneris TaxID=1133364 RepID=A0ABW3UKC6_9BACL
MKTEEAMDNNRQDDLIEKEIEATDTGSVPEGVKPYVDIIGDEKMDAFGNPASNFER